jgi:hypothetical protein
MGLLLVTCGLVLAGAGTWSGYRNAREAVVPFVREGDPTRSAIDAARPVHERQAVRRALRSALLALGWLALAMYGLLLAQTGTVLGGLG